MPIPSRVQINVAGPVWALPWNNNVMLLFWQTVKFSLELPVKTNLSGL